MNRIKDFLLRYKKTLLVILGVIVVLGAFTAVDLHLARVHKIELSGVSAYEYDYTKNNQKVTVTLNLSRNGKPVANHKIHALSLGGGNFASDTVISDANGNVTFLFYPYTETVNKAGTDITVLVSDTSNSVFFEINATEQFVMNKELLWPVTPLRNGLTAVSESLLKEDYSEEVKARITAITAEGVKRINACTSVELAQAAAEEYTEILRSQPRKPQELQQGVEFEKNFPESVDLSAEESFLNGIVSAYEQLTALAKQQVSDKTAGVIADIKNELYKRAADAFESRYAELISLASFKELADGDLNAFNAAYVALDGGAKQRLEETASAAAEKAGVEILVRQKTNEFKTAFGGYNQTLYSAAKWQTVTEIYNSSLAEIAAAETVKDAENAYNLGISQINAVDTLMVENAAETARAFEEKYAGIFALEKEQLSSADTEELKRLVADYDAFNNNQKILRNLSDNAYYKVPVIKTILQGGGTNVGQTENKYWAVILIGLVALLIAGGAVALKGGKRAE